MKIVINKCYGGFCLSKQAIELLGMEWDGHGHASDIDRADSKLVAIVETLGSLADGRHARLSVVEIPDDTKYSIEEYDGQEWIAEKHQTWE